MNQVIGIAFSNVNCFFLLQQQVLTPSAAESIAKSGHNLLIQAPILLAAFVGLVVAILKFRSYRLGSVLTIFASLLLLLSNLVNPLIGVWLPFFFAPAAQTVEDGTVVQPSLEILQTNIFYANLINSVVVAVALLMYLAAIFARRGRTAAAAKMTLKQPDINIPKISIR